MCEEKIVNHDSARHDTGRALAGDVYQAGGLGAAQQQRCKYTHPSRCRRELPHYHHRITTMAITMAAATAPPAASVKLYLCPSFFCLLVYLFLHLFLCVHFCFNFSGFPSTTSTTSLLFRSHDRHGGYRRCCHRGHHRCRRDRRQGRRHRDRRRCQRQRGQHERCWRQRWRQSGRP